MVLEHYRNSQCDLPKILIVIPRLCERENEKSRSQRARRNVHRLSSPATKINNVMSKLSWST